MASTKANFAVDTLNLNPIEQDIQDTLNSGAMLNRLGGVSGQPNGFVVVTNDTDSESQGIWQFSSNEGLSWCAVPSTASGPILLSNTTLLRFVPSSAFEGVRPKLTLMALDDTYNGPF